MAKHKNKRHRTSQAASRNPYSRSSNTAKPSSKAKSTSKPVQQLQQSQRPAIPFEPDDHILAVGEGNFSFSLSLHTHHADRFTSLLSTTYESSSTLLQKHPSISSTLATIEASPAGTVAYDVDATSLARSKPVQHALKHTTTKDAGGRRGAGFDWVVFNFPHTGGVSTDVNRQVRANQALLVGFFESVKGVLRPPQRHLSKMDNGGKVLVTLFDGEPYTLWNVRDLARHTGFQVVKSERFDWSLYEGYQHARTLGDLRRKEAQADEEEEWKGFSDDEQETAARPGAWRGEERPARSYVFEVKHEDDRLKEGGKRHKKKNDSDDSDSD